MNKLILPLAFSLLLTGCAIGPNYHRPAVDVPGHFRGVVDSWSIEKASLADQDWQQIFQDRQLQDLINTALTQNYDLHIAADHIIEAQQQLGITTSYELPTISATASPMAERVEKFRTTAPYTWSGLELTGNMSWDIDFWGTYRRMIEQAKATMLANQWAREEVVSTLVADVAGAYFQLRELDLELEISKETLKSRKESLDLVTHLSDHGSASMLDVRQAEQLVYTAAENIPDLQRRIQQQEDLISILIGNNPGAIQRGLALTQEPHSPQVPVGIPSLLLERRPDIREAEEQLVAANAQIGVAQGAYFPDISLTGTGGYESAALSKLFEGPSGLWDIIGTLSQPIFNGGRLRAGVKLARAQQDEALNIYRKTIQEAFREVADALIAYHKTREFTTQQSLLTQAASDAAHLSTLRYNGGTASYLEVLDSQNSYYSAQLGLAQAQLNELQSLVDLYKALGGGWSSSMLK